MSSARPIVPVARVAPNGSGRRCRPRRGFPPLQTGNVIIGAGGRGSSRSANWYMPSGLPDWAAFNSQSWAAQVAGTPIPVGSSLQCHDGGVPSAMVAREIQFTPRPGSDACRCRAGRRCRRNMPATSAYGLCGTITRLGSWASLPLSSIWPSILRVGGAALASFCISRNAAGKSLRWPAIVTVEPPRANGLLVQRQADKICVTGYYGKKIDGRCWRRRLARSE